MNSSNFTKKMKQKVFLSLKEDYNTLRCFGNTCYQSHNCNGKSKNSELLNNCKWGKNNWLQIFNDFCDKLKQYNHLICSYNASKKLKDGENEYLIQNAKRFGQSNLNTMMKIIPNKNEPKSFFELLKIWRLIYGRLLKFGKNSKRSASGLKFQGHDEILWAIFEKIQPCFVRKQFIKNVRSCNRITIRDICPWHPGNTCKCGHGTNEKGERFGEEYLCQSDFLNGECSCIIDFINSEPIKEHELLHEKLTCAKINLDNLKKGELEISKNNKKLMENEGIDTKNFDFEEVLSFLIKKNQTKWDNDCRELLKMKNIFGYHPTKLTNMVPLIVQWEKNQEKKVSDYSYCEELALLQSSNPSSKKQNEEKKSSVAKKEDDSDSDSDSDLDSDSDPFL